MKYNPTVHAVEQARIRFGVQEEGAKNWFNQLMETALYVTTQIPSGRKIYKHSGKDAMFVVDTKDNVIITILPKHGEGEHTKGAVIQSAEPKVTAYNAIIEKAREVITKEIAKARRQFTKDTRALTLHEAEIGFEIAKLSLNKARAKAPHIQALLQAQISDLENGRQAVFAELVEVKARFEQMRKDAEGYL